MFRHMAPGWPANEGPALGTAEAGRFLERLELAPQVLISSRSLAAY